MLALALLAGLLPGGLAAADDPLAQLTAKQISQLSGQSIA